MNKRRKAFRFVSAGGLLMLLIGASGCGGEIINEYSGLEHRGQKKISITQFRTTDTLFIDAGSTSLDGYWRLDSAKLFFFDHHMVGVREYSAEGDFVVRHIQQGKGPGEMLAPAFTATFSDDGDLVMVDGNWRFYIYDSAFLRPSQVYPFLSDLHLTGDDWQDLLREPDPELRQMYEFHPVVKRIEVSHGIMLMPVITEHIHFNGYSRTGDASTFWERSYNFIFVDLNNRQTGKLFGHYPGIYQRLRIPVFSSYDFDADAKKEQMYVTYAADSLIYVRDITDGHLLNSMGFASQGISGAYPQTSSFEEYESLYKQHRERYGYYTQISVAGDYLFRGYKMDDKKGYGLQIYNKGNMVGDIISPFPVRVLGAYRGMFYAELPLDIDNERFRLLRFQI